MNDCQPSLLSWGDPSIAWIAAHLRTPWLSSFMANLSDLGHAGPIFAVISLGYWFWNKHYTKYIAYGVFIALFVNLWIKGVIMECRPPTPFWMQDVKNSYSFPSGHAQVSIALWAGFAYYVRSKWYKSAFLLVGFLIALSRPYLGVHYIHDIIAGLLLGLGCLSLSIYSEKKQFVPLKRLSLKGQTFLILIGLGLYNWIVNSPSGNSIRASGAFFGFWLGCQWIHYLDLNSRIDYRFYSRLLQALIGFGVMFLLMSKLDVNGLELTPIQLSVVSFIQYMLLGLWVSFGAPAIFKKVSSLLKTS